MSKLNFVFIHGKGSCGKDTQADFLLEDFGETAIRISTGNIYREARDRVGEYGKYHDLVEPYIELVDIHGRLLPDSVIVDIVIEEVKQKIQEGKETFIFTGFPRTIGQLELIDNFLQSKEGTNSHHIVFNISDETSQERAKNRRQEAERRNELPREDDKEDVVEKRLKTFWELTDPMLVKLDYGNRLIYINAEGGIKDIERETSFKLSKEKE